MPHDGLSKRAEIMLHRRLREGVTRMARRNVYFFLTVLTATASGSTVQSAAPIPDFSGMWAHASIPGFEPLASGATSLRNLSRRDGGVSNNMQLVGDYTNPI